MVTDDAWQAYWAEEAYRAEQSLLADLQSVGVLEELNDQQQVVLADTLQETRDRMQVYAAERQDLDYQRRAPAVHKAAGHLLSAIMAARNAIDAVRAAAQAIPDPVAHGLAKFQSAVLTNCEEATKRLPPFRLGPAPDPPGKKPRPNEALDDCRMRMIELFESWKFDTKEAHQYTRRIEIACWPRKAGDPHGVDAWKLDHVFPKIGPDGLVDTYSQVRTRHNRRAAQAKSR